MENSPQVVFEKLFGDGGTTEQRLSRKREDRSILDSIVEQTLGLQKGLPSSDRARVDGYLEDIREIERRIKTVLDRESQAGAKQDVPEAPVGTPEAFEEHIKLMFDLLALAYQSETTRVATLMYAKDLSPSSYQTAAIAEDSTFIAPCQCKGEHGLVRTDVSTTSDAGVFHRAKLAKTPDGDGTLFDHSMLLYGSSMSNGKQHVMIPADRASGRGFRPVAGNRHIVTPAHTNVESSLGHAGQARRTGIRSATVRASSRYKHPVFHHRDRRGHKRHKTHKTNYCVFVPLALLYD
jgi:hypothetical protein